MSEETESRLREEIQNIKEIFDKFDDSTFSDKIDEIFTKEQRELIKNSLIDKLKSITSPNYWILDQEWFQKLSLTKYIS